MYSCSRVPRVKCLVYLEETVKVTIQYLPYSLLHWQQGLLIPCQETTGIWMNPQGPHVQCRTSDPDLCVIILECLMNRAVKRSSFEGPVLQLGGSLYERGRSQV